MSCEPRWAGFSLSHWHLLTPDFLSCCAWMSNVLLLFLPMMGSILSPLCHLCYLSHWLPVAFPFPAYNWIWVWDRGPVGSEIKEGRLSLHLRWGRQIPPISFLLQPLSVTSPPRHFWCTEDLSIQKLGIKSHIHELLRCHCACVCASLFLEQTLSLRYFTTADKAWELSMFM